MISDFRLVIEDLFEYFSKRPEQFYSLSPRGFEELIEAVFRNLGYHTELGPGGSDDGIDLRLLQKDSIGEILTLVQAKRYKSDLPIRLEAVAALSALVDAEKANRGLFVTTSRYLPGAHAFAKEKSKRLTLASSVDVADWCAQIVKAR